MNAITGLTPQQLRQAADIQEQILALQNELNALLGAPAAMFVAPTQPGTQKRNMNDAGRARIVTAAKARWARYRAERGITAKPPPTKKISEAGKARLSALAKLRWAKAKAAGKTRL